MTINKAKLMRAAWVIVRRFEGNGETLHARLSRALKLVWWEAKQEARRAAEAAARLAAQATVVVRPITAVLADIRDLECRSSLRGNDWDRLDALRAELLRAA